MENFNNAPYNSSSPSASITDAKDPCVYIKPMYTDERFWLVAVCGTSISIVSIIENFILFFVFFTRAQYRNSHYLYMMLLAIFDIFISVSYVLLMSVNVLMDYYDSVFLLRAWYFYMVPMITISHIAMTASSFLILAASFERNCITLTKKCLPVVQKRRKLIASLAILFGVFSKWTFALEYEITHDEQCAGKMSETYLDFSQLAKNETYNHFWRFLYRNIVTVFVPFFMLFYFNICTVHALQKYTAIVREEINTAQRKASVRGATRMLVMVVCTYLIANVLNVFITFLEFFDMDALKTNYAGFYTFSVDIVSLLTVVASALRLPIYCACQAEIRAHVLNIFFHNNCCSSFSGITGKCGSKHGHKQLSKDCDNSQQKGLLQNRQSPSVIRAPLITNVTENGTELTPLTVKVSSFLQDAAETIESDNCSLRGPTLSSNGAKKTSDCVDSGIGGDDIRLREETIVYVDSPNNNLSNAVMVKSESSSAPFYSVAMNNGSVPVKLYETVL